MDLLRSRYCQRTRQLPGRFKEKCNFNVNGRRGRRVRGPNQPLIADHPQTGIAPFMSTTTAAESACRNRQVVFNVGLDDLAKVILGLKTETVCTLGRKFRWPVGDD